MGVTSTCRPEQEIRVNLPGRIKVSVYRPLHSFQPCNEKKGRKKSLTPAAVFLQCITLVNWSDTSRLRFSGVRHTDADAAIGIRATQWLLYRLRSGFGVAHYITGNIGQNGSVTYESAVQLEVTVSLGGKLTLAVFWGCGSSLAEDTCAPGEECFLLPPRFISRPLPPQRPPPPPTHHPARLLARTQIFSLTFHIAKTPLCRCDTL